MKKYNTYTVEFTLTERTVRQIDIVAETPEEAVETVEDYGFDNDEAVEKDSLEWSVDNVKLIIKGN